VWVKLDATSSQSASIAVARRASAFPDSASSISVCSFVADINVLVVVVSAPVCVSIDLFVSASFLPLPLLPLFIMFGQRLMGNFASSGRAGGISGCIEACMKNYTEKYIRTSSFKPVLHVIGLYSFTHWAFVQSEKHKYQVNHTYH